MLDVPTHARACSHSAPCGLKVRGGDDGCTRYRRLGSSCVGGSTFWGLVKLLTSCDTYDEVIRLTEMESASSARVDMQVESARRARDEFGDECVATGDESVMSA